MALSAQEEFPLQPTARVALALKPSDLELDEVPTGFEGAMSNLTLSDVIQLEGQNQFSGSILVVHGEQEGKIYFLQGEIVHAEAGNQAGEQAFCQIMGWPGGQFKLRANVTSLHHTIQKRREHLLLRAHQWLDESRQGMTDSAVSMAPPESTASSRTKNTLQAICGVPGVSHAVTMDQDGIPRGEVGDHGQALAGRGLYLATIIGAPIGEALGLGDLLVAALHGGPDKMLLFKSRGNYLTVALAPEASLDSVETGIRQAVSPRTGVK